MLGGVGLGEGERLGFGGEGFGGLAVGVVGDGEGV